MKYSVITCFIVIILFSGCARLNSIARDLNVNDGNGQLIDAKQRAIVVIQKKDTNETIVCTEPSPDALSAYTMQLALEGNVPETVAAKIAASSQEGTSYAGLRTQSIQLLRDAMYRNCEAYANGALNKAEYGIASRRYQRSMVALLAIEQLTGAIRVPPITITAVGVAEVAKSLSEMQSEVDTIDEEIDTINKEITKIEDNNATAKTDERKELKAKLEKQKYSKEQNKKAINEGIANARGVITTGKVYATIVGDSIIHRSDQHIEKVADTVYKIFDNLNDADDFTQMCLSYLVQNDTNSLTDVCKNRLQEMTNEVKQKIEIKEVLAEHYRKILENNNSSKEEKEAAIKLLKETYQSPTSSVKSMSVEVYKDEIKKFHKE